MMNQTQHEAREKFINTVAQVAHDGRLSDEQIVKTVWALWGTPEFENLDLQLADLDKWERLNNGIERRMKELREEVSGCEPKPYTKRMTAIAWFEFQKKSNVQVIDVETVYVDGEKLMQATFWLN